MQVPMLSDLAEKLDHVRFHSRRIQSPFQWLSTIARPAHIGPAAQRRNHRKGRPHLIASEHYRTTIP